MHAGAMRGEDPWASPDPLGEALHYLGMTGTFDCRSELTAPWQTGWLGALQDPQIGQATGLDTLTSA